MFYENPDILQLARQQELDRKEDGHKDKNKFKTAENQKRPPTPVLYLSSTFQDAAIIYEVPLKKVSIG